MNKSNAERQRLFRERRKAQLEENPNEVSRLLQENAMLREQVRALQKPAHETAMALTPEQHVDRSRLLADLTSERAWWRKARNPPRFLGWTRDQWLANATPDLQELFGLKAAIEVAGRLMQLDLSINLEKKARRLKNKSEVATFD